MGDKRDFIYRMVFRIVFFLAVFAGVKAQAMSHQDEQLLAQAKVEAEQELASLQKKYDKESRAERSRIQAMKWEFKPIVVASQDPTCEGGDCEDEEVARSSNVKSSIAADFPKAP